jgi:hypothetical protein
VVTRLPGSARRLLRLGLLASCPLLLGHAPPAVAATPTEVEWLPGGYVDYAPAGLPDFSQCRAEWSQPGSPAQWTYAAPVAAADVLWWLDSVAETQPRPPAVANDHHPLVTFYPIFGPNRDDHDPQNLGPLVEDLAVRVNTDGRRDSAVVRGTRWELLVEGIGRYLADRRLQANYPTTVRTVPDVGWLADQVARGAGTILLLGVWEDQGGQWKRVGGHYAALAGAERAAGRIGLADPLADAAAGGGTGRLQPTDPGQHSCRTAPRAHDDAAVLAHDLYALQPLTGLPDGRQVLDGYFTPASYGEAAAFAGQNPATLLAVPTGSWQRGPVVMAVDAALAIAPAGAAVPTATPSPQPTATATPAATRTPTAGTVATATGGPLLRTPIPTVQVARGRLYLPLAVARW